MKEEFLHYLWKCQLYEPLLLSNNELVEVLSAGEHNFDSGPDFFNAKIRIGDTLWAGNVEIHVNSSDWIKHKHQINPAFDNVILHVVANNDTQIFHTNGKPIPTVELKSKRDIYEQFLYLMQSSDWVPCEAFISKVDDFTILQWKEALLVERMQQKTEIIDQRFDQNTQNWEETFYQTLAANFGFKVNAQPFEMLARSLPLKYLAKHKDELPLVEAMLFGQSGLLPEQSNNAYEQKLIANYKHLQRKFNLSPLSPGLWKFSRLRPANFPTLRIAQFAGLIHQSVSLFSQIIQASTFNDLEELFNISASEFWNTHYNFYTDSACSLKKLGQTAFQNMLINTIVPLLFLYGKKTDNQLIIQKGMQWLNNLPAEQNNITKKWKELSLVCENAFDSQALIQLKNVYCKNRKCLNCRIGNKVIRHPF